MTTPAFLLVGLASLLFSLAVCAQSSQPSTLFSASPRGWESEVIPFPLPFAPELGYEGVEELRFAPGMFEAGSATYFTYSFIWWLNGKQGFDAETLQADLLAYFAGLYRNVSRTNEKSTKDFSATVERLPAGPKQQNQVANYKGTIYWTDPFVTEQPLALNVKASTWFCPDQNRTAVIFLLSPQPFEGNNWKVLDSVEAIECRAVAKRSNNNFL